VHHEIEFMPLESAATAGADGTDLSRLYDVPVELAVEIGRTRMTIGQTLDLRPGSVVSLNRLAGEPVDLLINGKPIARGEVVVIDEEFGLRVTDVVSTGRSLEEEAETAEEAAARAEAELLASIGAAEEPQPLPDPLSDPFADASVDDLPIGGLPEPGVVEPELG
jgi:flagellar motor switch protein FliN